MPGLGYFNSLTTPQDTVTGFHPKFGDQEVTIDATHPLAAELTKTAASADAPTSGKKK